MKLFLHHKILLGHIVFTVIIIACAVLLSNKYSQLNKLEKEAFDIQSIQMDVNMVHHRITRLSAYGESVVTWSDYDFENYKRFRNETDSLLICLKQPCIDYISPELIDTLRQLLIQKEEQLYDIVKVIQNQRSTDSILANQMPDLVKNHFSVRKIVRKKRGLAGLFGKKETLYIPYKHNLSYLNDTILTDYISQNNKIEESTDSLRFQNKILNRKLYQLITLIDRQIGDSFLQRGEQISSANKESYFIFSFVLVLAFILLISSFYIIRSEIYKEGKIREKLKLVIHENEELLNMRDKIILTVSHDIRGPVGNIHNCADLISDTQESKECEQYLEDIRYSCHHILHLVNNLMDAYRINETEELKNDTPFSIDRFLQRITDEFSRKANLKGLIFNSLHKNTAQTVKGDVDKLEQILANLLTNAIKFTPTGSVHFHSEYSGGKLQVEISDTGIGMDKETLNRIFEPFERAAQNVNSEGFGLGLYLTKGLVKVLDGNLEVESVLGKGTLFRLEFPLPETNESEREDSPEYGQIITLPKRVLVVDDDPILLKIAEDMLDRKGIICTTCLNVKEVMAALGQADYDVVLTDIQKPGSDGFDLLKLLRNSGIGNSKTVPVAVMTARGDGNTGIYEKEGFAGCIHKPFNIRSLLAFLSSIVSTQKPSCGSNFDFTYLLESTDDGKYILSLVSKESKEELEELEQALETVDCESIRNTVHRMIPVWEILGKDSLLRDFQTILHNENSNNNTICEHTREIMKWLNLLIQETGKELKKYEDTDC